MIEENILIIPIKALDQAAPLTQCVPLATRSVPVAFTLTT